jgi:hypothetical protein
MRSIKENAYWVTNEDETGLVLYFKDGVMLDKTGSQIRVSFDELTNTAQEKVITTTRKQRRER